MSPTTALLSPSSACATGTCIDARRLVQSLKIKDNFTTRGRNNISSFVPAPPTVELTDRGRGAVVDGYLVCDGRGLGQLFDPVLVVLVRIQALNHSRRNAWSVANPALAPFNFTPTQEFDGGHVAKGLNVSSWDALAGAMVPFPGFVTTTVYHSSSTSEGWGGALLLGQELLAQGSLPTALWISNLETKPRTTASNSKGFQFNCTNRLDIL